MLSYFLRRLLGAIPTLFIIITATFFLIRLAPGGPFDEEQTLPDEIRRNLEAHYHLDRPMLVQYGYYLRGLVRGDFGPSFKFKDFSVTDLIAQGFPISLRLGALAMVLALCLGLSFGTLAALKQNRGADYGVMAFAMLGIVIPNFVFAPLLSLLFGIYLGWLPVAGWNGGELRHMVLPVIALALPYVAYIARLTRGSMIDVLRSNYIRTARAKALPTRIVVGRHAFKAAVLPVVSFLGPATAGIVTGSVVIEQIFSIPGIGRYFVQGALNRDYFLVMGVVIFYATLIILLNLLVDMVYALLDPKVRYEK